LHLQLPMQSGPITIDVVCSAGTPISSTDKTDRHDITETLFKPEPHKVSREDVCYPFMLVAT